MTAYECHIQDHLTQELLLSGSKHIVHEVGVLRGGVSRIDVLDFTTCIHGYEIKTSVDSLSRLPSQVENYRLCLDKITLVVATKHLVKALDIIPGYWGITEIVEIEDAFTLIPVRKAESNPDIDIFQYASLLWADELAAFLKSNGQYKQLYSKAHYNMAKRAASLCTVDSLRKVIIRAMNERNNMKHGNAVWTQKKLM